MTLPKLKRETPISEAFTAQEWQTLRRLCYREKERISKAGYDEGELPFDYIDDLHQKVAVAANVVNRS